MWGSRPLPDAVTRSTGTETALPGSAARSASTRPWTVLTRSALVGLRFEPEEEPALSAKGLADERRAHRLAILDDEAAVGLGGKQRLGNAGDDERIADTGDERHQQENHEGRPQMLTHDRISFLHQSQGHENHVH